ncbi:MAG: hypothetical protein GY850_21000 [bacterium]|nr:hypothetical protein [bacterium]
MEEQEEIIEKHDALSLVCEAIITGDEALCSETTGDETEGLCITLTLIREYIARKDCNKLPEEHMEICKFAQNPDTSDCEGFVNNILMTLCKNNAFSSKDCSSFDEYFEERVLCECFNYRMNPEFEKGLKK